LRLKALNKKVWDETEVYLNSAQDLVKYKAEQEVAIAGFDRANEEIGKIEDEFSDYYFGMDINRTSNNCFTMELATTNVNSTATESEKLGKLEFSTKDWQHGTTPLTLTVTTAAESGTTVTASNNCYSLSGSSDVFYVTIECFAAEDKSLPESFSVVACPRFYDSERQKCFDKELTFWCKKSTDGKLKASRAINVADRESTTF
jgi:hypothetical protein